MIPRLYEHNATTFTSFGIGVLKDTTSCEVTEERNGKYELVLKYPLNGRLYSEIQKERIIYAQVNDNKSLQAFRIYRITAPISGFITIYAQHISYDLSGVVVFPCDFTNTTPSNILSFISQRRLDRNIPFTFSSDIASTSDFHIANPRTFRNVIGGDKDSLISTFGGEVEWDNYNVSLKISRGSDNGISILYGKNLTKLEHNSDLSSIYTHLCPYAIIKDGDDETYLELPEKVLPIVTTLNERKVLIMDFSSYFGSGDDAVEPTVANLRNIANDYLIENILGIESPNITLSFEELRNQRGYQNLHETVKLCDTVTVKYAELGVNIKTQIVKVVYDTLKEKYKSLTLGTIKTSLEDRIVSLEKGVEDNEKEISEVPSHIKVAVDEVTDKITGANGGCVVLNLDNQERPYEFLIMDNYDIQDASKVWRWNINGLGYSPNGYNGPYTTAITNDGHIVADFVDTGTLTADIIKAGKIQAITGTSYWDLESGDINITGKITTSSGSIGNFTIDSNSLSKGTLGTSDCVLLCSGSTTYASIAGSPNISGWSFVAGDKFGVTKDGYLYASNVSLSGEINATSGYISNFKINSDGISTGPTTVNDHTINGLYLANGGINFNSGVSQTGYSTVIVKPSGTINNVAIGPHLLGERYYHSTGYTYKNNFILGSNILSLKSYDSDTTFGNYVTYRTKIYSNDAGQEYVNSFVYPSIESDDEFVGTGKESGLASYTSSVGHIWDSYIGYVPDIYIEMVTYSVTSSSNHGQLFGTWRSSSAIVVSSDRNKKKDIEVLDERYSTFFNNLNPVRFKYKDGKSSRYHTGFIAQEVIEALSQSDLSEQELAAICTLRNKDDSEELGIRYEEIIALCVNEIQKLKSRVKELEEKE